jgi:phosphonate transport system substrate-binding protein
MSRQATVFRIALAALLLIFAAAPVPSSAQWREAIPALQVGILAGNNPAYVQSQSEPFRRYLEGRLGVDVQIVPALDYATLIRGQVNGSLHAAFLSATAFAAASAACGGCVEPLVLPTAPDGGEGYHSVLLVRPGSPIRGVADLAGRRLAVSAADSVAGRLLPLSLFAQEGVTERDLVIVERHSPEAAVAALLAGEADAALAWSTLRGDAAAGYGDGVLTQMVAAGTLAMSNVVIAWRSPLIPYGPLSVQADLPDELKAALTAAMVGVREEDPAAFTAIERSLGGGFRAADAALFEPLLVLVAPDAGG